MAVGVAVSYFVQMAFPFEPSAAHPVDKDGKFVIDDPWGLRKSVFPLLNQTNESGLMKGWGTAFRIDPYGTAVTAHHVIDDFFKVVEKGGKLQLSFQKERRLFGLQGMGLVYGSVGIPPKFWMPVDSVRVHVFEKPSATLVPEFRSLTETAVLHMPPKSGEGAQPLPVKIRHSPKVGERLLALGFADLKIDQAMDELEAFTLTENLYGSIGKIVEIRPADPKSMRPWPTMIVNADWPLGMSGGPVFNEAGQVVGLVSSGLDGQYSTAVWFGGWDLHEKEFSHLDPSNPMCLIGWAAIQNDAVAAFALEKSKVDARAIELGIDCVIRISFNLDSGGFMTWGQLLSNAAPVPPVKAS